ncbi:MAG: HEAT repeat domain-containing protein [Verrucomicrobia bacterium]|nr:HEAT repeat domain-containing protein [Verrucomicrobiota bacterium]
MESLEHLAADATEEERRHAILEASPAGDRRNLPTFIALLETETPANRRHVVRALGNLGAAEVTPVLLRLLHQEDGIILGDVARAVGRLGIVEARPRLEVLKGHPVAWVADSAAWALRQASPVSPPGDSPGSQRIH